MAQNIHFANNLTSRLALCLSYCFFPSLSSSLKAQIVNSNNSAIHSSIENTNINTVSGIKQHSTYDRVYAKSSGSIRLENFTFPVGSEFEQLFTRINLQISRGQPVALLEIKNFFQTLSDKRNFKIPASFFIDFSGKFKDPAVTKIIVDFLNPESKGWENRNLITHDVVKAGNFPIDTIRGLLQSTAFNNPLNGQNLDTRAQKIALCLGLNVDPGQQLHPAELIRASQFLSLDERGNGTEILIGILLAKSLKNNNEYKILAEHTDSIRMPLIRRMQTLERRYPGTQKALLDSGIYLAYLDEQARFLVNQRLEFENSVILGNKEQFLSIMHVDQTFHFGVVRDVARAFGGIFDPKTDATKGVHDPSNVGPKKRYFELLERAAKDSQHRYVMWHYVHGLPDMLCFSQGEGLNAPMPTANQYISPEELGSFIVQHRLTNVTFFTDSCYGWNYTENVNKFVIGEYIKNGMSIDNIALPLNIAITQNGMTGRHLVVDWQDDDLPNNQRTNVEVGYSLTPFRWMIHCKAIQLGVTDSEITGIGPTNKPFTLTGADFFNTDLTESNVFDKYLETHFQNRQGTYFETSNPNLLGTDSALFAPRLINFDKVHNECLESLREKGLKVPTDLPVQLKDDRPTDHVIELSFSPSNFPKQTIPPVSIA